MNIHNELNHGKGYAVFPIEDMENFKKLRETLIKKINISKIYEENIDYVRKIDGQWIFKGAVITVVWNFTTTSGDDGLTGDFEQWIQMGAKVSNREKGTFTIDYSEKPWTLDWIMSSSGIRRISLFNFGDNETLNVITGESKPEDWEDCQIMQYKYGQ